MMSYSERKGNKPTHRTDRDESRRERDSGKMDRRTEMEGRIPRDSDTRNGKDDSRYKRVDRYEENDRRKVNSGPSFADVKQKGPSRERDDRNRDRQERGREEKRSSGYDSGRRRYQSAERKDDVRMERKERKDRPDSDSRRDRSNGRDGPGRKEDDNRKKRSGSRERYRSRDSLTFGQI